MKFGLGPISGQIPPASDQSVDELYEQALQLTEKAEDVGFDSAWVSEHHFTADGYLPSPLVLAGGIAARTSSLEVGTALALAPLYEPVRLAEDAAVAANLSRGGGDDGRFSLGLGLGYRDIEYDGVRVERSDRVGRLLDVVDVCRAAWNSEPLGPGRTVEYPDVTVSPTPTSDINILIGAMAPTALRRAARVGDGYLVPPSVSLDELSEKLEIVASELSNHGRDPSDFPIYMLRYGFVHEAGEQAAWEAIRDEYMYLRRKYLEWFNESDDSDLNLTEEMLDEMVADNESKWRSWAICGDTEDWVDALKPYDACWEGEITAITQLRYPGMHYDDVDNAIDLFGSDVIPALRE